MKTRFELTVIQPQISVCQESPDNMLPHELGKFCLHCNKAVHDLKHMDAEALISYLQKNEGSAVCGSINPEILNRPVIQLNKLEKEYARQFKFILALFFAFGPLLFSCNEKDHQEIKKAIAISIEDKGEAYLPAVVSPDAQEDLISFVTCGCEYEEKEPEIKIPDTADQDILLDPVYIYGDQEFITRNDFLGGLTVNRCFTQVVEIDSIESPEPEIVEINRQVPLLVYPNPARDQIHINYEIIEQGTAILSLFNINGQKINDFFSALDAKPGTYSDEFNVSNLSSGMYILILVNNQHKEVFRLNVAH